MTDDERQVMQQHVVYWTGLMQKGTAIVFGPVLDPAGAYGVGVVAVENEEGLRSLIDNDPAKTICAYDFRSMRAVYPSLKT